MFHTTLLFLIFLPQIILAGTSCNIMYQLEDMSYCKMGLSFDAYRNYGCACSGIAPDKPIDGIDRCCEYHNQCYNLLISSKKCENANAPYFCLYKWECVFREPSCRNDNKCLQSVCQCDEQFINCLAKYPYPFMGKKCFYIEAAADPIMKILKGAKSGN